MMSATSVNSSSPKPRAASARRADAQARGDARGARVEGTAFAVHGDAHGVQEVFGLLAVEVGVAQVDEHEVHVGASGEDGDACLGDVGAVRRSAMILAPAQHAVLTLGELLGGGDLEGDGPWLPPRA